MQIINPTGILYFDDNNMDSKYLTKIFNNSMFGIKDSDTPTIGEFTTLGTLNQCYT